MLIGILQILLRFYNSADWLMSSETGRFSGLFWDAQPMLPDDARSQQKEGIQLVQ